MSISMVALGLAGAVFGLILLEEAGLFFGLVLGLALGKIKELSDRITTLEKQVAAARGPVHAPAKPAESGTAGAIAAAPEKAISKSSPAPSSAYPRPPAAHTGTGSTKQPPGQAPPPNSHATPPLETGRLFQFVRDFFTRGNVVVKIGLIVLFFGVAFLIKYAAQRQLLPVELRLAAVALGGMIMLVSGWKLRDRNAAYALLIQGGGVGVLYLTIFGAARLYHLLPMGLAFFLLIAMVALSAMLALLQNSPPLAAFGAIGGFAAPVLVSTGTGSHILLFSYYALLNTGILGIAWFRSWRSLNWIGFVFTFVVGAAWGYRYYRPEFFGSTEPFLILFFLFYVAISVLFAHRQPVELKGYIDGSLVFGLPVAAFALQSALVRGTEYGMAASALALGGFYIGLATILWNRRIEGMRLLTEAFLSLGVVFASIAIPLGLDSGWTAGLWCVEGAGLVWIGVRQNRFLARCAGLLLQIGAGAAFFLSTGPSADSLPVANGTYMNCLLISLSAFVSNRCHQHYRERLKAWEQPVHIGLLIWGLLWWFGGGFCEIDFHLRHPDHLLAAVPFIAASGWIAGWLSRRFEWTDIGYPAMAAIPAVAVIAWNLFLHGPAHPFAGWGAAAWTLALISGYHLLYRSDGKWPDLIIRGSHPLLFTLAVFILTWESAWAIGQLVGGAEAWKFGAWGLVPSLIIVSLLRYGPRISWPVMRFESQYLGEGLLPMIIFLWGWIVAGCFRAAGPAPLVYLPLVNPLEIVQAYVFWTLIRWRTASGPRLAKLTTELPPHSMAVLMLATAFLWINAVIARTVHFWVEVEFSGPALFDSVHFQSSLSIAWTLAAFGLMAAAARRKSRKIWFAGAILLAAVVAKLFLVDLAGIGTVARIVSFLAVGMLMLAIGYVSPLPPKPNEAPA